MRFFSSAGAVLLSSASLTSAIDLNPDDAASIRSVARTYAYGLMSEYVNNATDTPPNDIGIFPRPHYWWAAGAAWGGMIEYTEFTGDDSHVKTLQQALTSNYGPNNDIILPWRKDQQGNDDQAFWALAVMSALEYQFPDPADAPASYLEVVENAFENIVGRWDTTSCGGGLKWQIYPENAYGYNYKNSISNGCTFALGARLARYTGKQTYADWSVKIYDWVKSVGLIGDNFEVYDGTGDEKNCSEVADETQWSYNIAMFMHGSAYMYDFTKGDELWQKRTAGFVDHSAMFFKPYDNATDIMYEPACETGETGRHCNLDQQSFKAYLARFLAKTAIMAPFTKDTITNYLKKSALGAAKSCSGGDDGVTCGSKWYTGGWDGTSGVGQQLSALEVTHGLLQLQNNIVPVKNGDAAPEEPKPESTSTPTPTPEPSKAPAESSKPAQDAPSTPKPTPEAPKSTAQAEAPKTTVQSEAPKTTAQAEVPESSAQAEAPQPTPDAEKPAPEAPSSPSNSSTPDPPANPDSPAPAPSNEASPEKPGNQCGEPAPTAPGKCTCTPSKTVTVYVPPASATPPTPEEPVPSAPVSSAAAEEPVSSAPAPSVPVPSEPAASEPVAPPPVTTAPVAPSPPPAEPPVVPSTTAAGVAPPANTSNPGQPEEFQGAAINVRVTGSSIMGAAALALLAGLL